MKKILGVFFAFFGLVLTTMSARAAETPPIGPEYAAMKKDLSRGWNTWDTTSVLSHALLPEGLALRMQLRDDATGNVLENSLIGRNENGKEQVRPGPHTYDGSYTELTIKWQGMYLRVRTAATGDDFVALVTEEPGSRDGTFIIRPEMLWKRAGRISAEKNEIVANTPAKTVKVFIDGRPAKGADVTAPAVALALNGPIGISTSKKRSAREIEKFLAAAERKYEKSQEKYGKLEPLHEAMQSVLAWNVIYEPQHDRVITPVSRGWSIGWGGYVLFDWDTYFASYMLSLDSRELAYANAIEVTKGITDTGFVPNYAAANGNKSFDRSQPPVGSMIAREIYRRYREKWFLREVFDNLLRWNRWWPANRETDGYLCWGSNPFKNYYGKLNELYAINNWQGAAWESGLDNSPMYDDVPFDTKRHQLKLADVGLMSLYIADCDALADIADELGKTAESAELRARAETYRRKLAELWDETSGIYLNLRTDTKEPSHRLSPTNFYPLLARTPTKAQAERMIREHFYSPEEFWGEWIIPSIARNDPGFKDNSYWRGRVWAPMNFLVYMGLRIYDLSGARKDLVDKSAKILLKSWTTEGHVHENYNSVTGEADDMGNSDPFYHWGALMGFISFIEKGIVPAPEKPL